MAALNYSHNIMGKKDKSSLPSFISKAVGKWGVRPLNERNNKMMLGEVSGREECWQQALLKMLSNAINHYYTNLSSPDARGRTERKRISEEDENRANPLKPCSSHLAR